MATYLKKFGLLAVIFAIFIPAYASDLTPNGVALRQFYDSFDVDNLWQKGYRVDWQTGKSLRPADNPKVTHCSAFVASVLQKDDHYILRPPSHPLKNLANAQWDYLHTPQATQDGWLPLFNDPTAIDYAQVQDKANQGYITVAVLKSIRPHSAGHIAFIYPNAFSPSALTAEDVRVIQAGYINGKNIPLLQGFARHKDSLQNLQFYYYQMPFDSYRALDKVKF